MSIKRYTFERALETKMTKKIIGKVPLERALSKRGLASRKVARELIEKGQVFISGKVIKDPLYMVTPETMDVKIEGHQTAPEFSPLFLVLNKPKSCVCTTKDEKNRKTVYSYLTHIDQKIISVGRLDFATTGLLFFTNVNRLMDFLTDPKNEISRSYYVTVRGELTEEKCQKLCIGLYDQDEFLKAEKVVLKKSSQRESHFVIILKEGKNREIRRLLLAIGHEVTALKRISYGNFELDLEPGESRLVTFQELAQKIPETKDLLSKLNLL
jgi:23S rRNA pseudouridine2605 synthase